MPWSQAMIDPDLMAAVQAPSLLPEADVDGFPSLPMGVTPQVWDPVSLGQLDFSLLLMLDFSPLQWP